MEHCISDDEVQELAEKHDQLEHMLLAAPESICKLAQLLLVASCASDFDVKEPIGGFKTSLHQSFCANLLEVVIAGHNALNTAEDNIQEVSMHTDRVPDYVADVFSAILEEEPENITKRLQLILARILVVARSCSELVAKSDAKFEVVTQLTLELAQVCTSTRGDVEAKSANSGISDKIDIQQLDLREVRDILLGGIKALGNVRKQWQSMGRFFQDFSNLVTIDMQETFESLATYSTSVGEGAKEDRTGPSDGMLNILFDKAVNLNKLSFQISSLAATYLSISQDHLVPTSRNLGMLLTLNAKTEMAQIQQKLEEVQRDCEEVQKAIVTRAKENKETMMRDFQGLMDTMRDYVTQGRAKLLATMAEDDPDSEAQSRQEVAAQESVEEGEQAEEASDPADSTHTPVIPSEQNTNDKEQLEKENEHPIPAKEQVPGEERSQLGAGEPTQEVLDSISATTNVIKESSNIVPETHDNEEPTTMLRRRKERESIPLESVQRNSEIKKLVTNSTRKVIIVCVFSVAFIALLGLVYQYVQ